MEEDYKGHKITVTKFLEFEVTGPLFDTGKHFDTAQKCREAIDKREKAQESQEREKLSIPLLTETGERVTLIGLHGLHYSMLGFKTDRYGSGVYPAIDWIEALLKERAQLKARIDQISNLTGNFRMSTGSKHFRSHAEAVAAVKAEIARMEVEAIKQRPQ